MKTLNKLLNSRLFKEYIIKDYNVLGIYIGGSRQTGLNDESSDYDLVVVYDEPYNIYGESYVQILYKDTHIHWYYINIREFASYRDKAIPVFGKLYPFTLDTEFIYGDFNLDWLKKFKYDYFKIATYKFYETKLKRFKEDISKCHPLQYSKVLYYGEVLFYLITNSKLNLDYLKGIKDGIKERKLSSEQVTTINNHLCYIRDFVALLKFKSFDVDYEIMLLNMKIYEEYQKCIETN